MNERIIIEKNAVAVDKIGNHVNTWKSIFPVTPMLRPMRHRNRGMK